MTRHFEAVFDRQSGRLFALGDPAAPEGGILVTCPATANLYDPGPCICGAEPEHYAPEWLVRDDERAAKREEEHWTAPMGEFCMYCGVERRFCNPFWFSNGKIRCQPCFLRERDA